MPYKQMQRKRQNERKDSRREKGTNREFLHQTKAELSEYRTAGLTSSRDLWSRDFLFVICMYSAQHICMGSCSMTGALRCYLSNNNGHECIQILSHCSVMPMMPCNLQFTNTCVNIAIPMFLCVFACEQDQSCMRHSLEPGYIISGVQSGSQNNTMSLGTLSPAMNSKQMFTFQVENGLPKLCKEKM